MSLKIIPYLLFRLLLQGVFINPTDEKGTNKFRRKLDSIV